MTALKIGILEIDENGSVRIHDKPVILTPKPKLVFNRIAAAQGLPVPKSAFIEAGEVTNLNSLFVTISGIRKAFEPHIQGPVFRSTPSVHGYKKEVRFDGYALNLQAFNA